MAVVQPAPRTHKDRSAAGQFTVPFSSGQSRIPTVTAEWPGCRCLAEPPPLTCFDSTRAAIADVSTPTPWRTRPGLSRATPFNAARLDAPLPLSPLPPPRFLPGSRLGSLCAWAFRALPAHESRFCAPSVLGSHASLVGENETPRTVVRRWCVSGTWRHTPAFSRRWSKSLYCPPAAQTCKSAPRCIAYPCAIGDTCLHPRCTLGLRPIACTIPGSRAAGS